MTTITLASRRLAALCVAVAAVASTEALAQQAFVRGGGEVGQGLYFRNGAGACLLMTPRHVTKGDTAYIAARGPRGLMFGEATPVFADPELDLEISLVRGAVANQCGDYVLFAPRVEALLQQNPVGGVRTILDDGSAGVTPVALIDLADPWVRIAPAEGEELRKGMSGSIALFGGSAAAMLVQVEEGGIGKALRLDRAYEAALAQRIAPQAPGSAGPEVVGWEGFPKSSGYGPSNLLAPTNGPAGAVAIDQPRFPVQFVIDMGVVATVAAIDFAPPPAVGVCSPAAAAARVSVSTGPSAGGPWLEASAASLAPASPTRLALNRAVRFVRLVITENQGDANCLVVATVRFAS